MHNYYAQWSHKELLSDHGIEDEDVELDLEDEGDLDEDLELRLYKNISSSDLYMCYNSDFM